MKTPCNMTLATTHGINSIKRLSVKKPLMGLAPP
mgnify:CR=1 FL=1